MPRPAMTEAAITCVAGIERREQIERQAEPDDGADDRPRRPACHVGTRCPERPTQVIDWVRASCIAPRLTTATATDPRQRARSVGPRPTGWRPSSARRRCWRRRRRRELGARNQLDVAKRRASRLPTRALRAPPIPRPEVGPKSNAYNDLEPRTSARRSTCRAG